ncbi:hypothetical protein [Chryseobacterium sp. MP_3.2]|uniref:hypothetical protein n=1 Tax=Chryseobacterium sp. MP_3.2 TaxID=3071712 RepID=UPI002DF866BC|nr:hypothetical protein [Chryseobacterium sp. MP_3.2]
MKKIYTFLLLFTFLISSAQDLQKIAKEITAEGIILYRSEMASWYGTDIFLANYPQRENIAGYFSYLEDGVPKCIFFSKDEKVIGTISFPTNYESKDAKLDLKERDFSETEKNYFELQQKVKMRTLTDPIFKQYENYNFNIIPIITKTEKKTYLLTGTNDNNLVLFGNDYLINFNQKNEITTIQPLHKSLIPQKMVDEQIGKSVSAVHSHVLEDWPFITPTDICTLMLYQKFTGWENYTVISKKYTSLWNAKSNFLVILKTDVIKKINQDQKK